MQVQLMTPDDFPDITPTNRYHSPRPKEAFGSVADATMEPEEPDDEEQPVCQLRCELEITNTGEQTPPVDLPAKCVESHTHQMSVCAGDVPGHSTGPASIPCLAIPCLAAPYSG